MALQALQQTVRHTEGLAGIPYTEESRDSENEYFRQIWNSPYLKEIRTFADTLVAADGRPYVFGRGQMIIFSIIALERRKDVKTAHTRVQTDAELRAIAGFAPASPATRKKFRDPKYKGKEIREPGIFPSRRAVSDFHSRWAATEHGRPLIERIRRAACVDLVTDVCLKYGGQTSLVAADFTRCQSPLKRDGKRKDEGAKWFGRGAKEKMLFCRMKETLFIHDLMLVAHGGIGADAEINLAVRLPAQLAEVSEAMERRALDLHGVVDGPSLRGAAIAGDSVFRMKRFLQAAHEEGFTSVAYPLAGLLDRYVQGEYEVALRDGTKAIVQKTNDDFFYCEHDAHLELEERTPMKVHMGAWTTERRHIHVECVDPVCEHAHRRRRFYLSSRQPDRVVHGVRMRGDIDPTAINPLYAASAIKAVVMNHVATNAVEHYHRVLKEFGLAAKGDEGKLKIFGNTAHDFYYALADLLFNLRIRRNLELGVDRRPFDLEQTHTAAIRKSHQVSRNKEEAKKDRDKRIADAIARATATPSDNRRNRQANAPPADQPLHLALAA